MFAVIFFFFVLMQLMWCTASHSLRANGQNFNGKSVFLCNLWAHIYIYFFFLLLVSSFLITNTCTDYNLHERVLRIQTHSNMQKTQIYKHHDLRVVCNEHFWAGSTTRLADIHTEYAMQCIPPVWILRWRSKLFDIHLLLYFCCCIFQFYSME